MSAVAGVMAGTALLVAGQAPGQNPTQERPTFAVRIDLVTTDTIVRDASGQFVFDLTRDEFEISEDGVRQEIASMTLVHGGRVTNVLAPPPSPAIEGIVLPSARQVHDVSGRIFLFFVDDLHTQSIRAGSSGRSATLDRTSIRASGAATSPRRKPHCACSPRKQAAPLS